jgi:hypothetical protein
MAVVNDLFDTFLHNIEPDDEAVSYAQDAHKPIWEHLEQDEQFKYYFEDTFLYGSYRRHTAIGTIKDIDIVVLTNFDTRSRDNTPSAVLRKLKAALKRYYNDPENQEYQRRSIRINQPLPKNTAVEMTLDIIPAVPVTDNDGILLVPDRESRRWIRTNPKGHIEYITELNDERHSKGKFVPLAKMMKWWWKYQCSIVQPDKERPKPKGFWIECLAAERFDPAQEDMASHFIKLLFNISQTYKYTAGVPTLNDPGLKGETIKANITTADFQLFMKTVNASLALAIQAYQEADEGKSSRLWQQVFGEAFPVYEQVADTKVFHESAYPLGSISHAAPLPWRENLQYKVNVDAYLYSPDRRIQFRGINSDARFRDNLRIKYIASTNAPAPYEVYWQVVNTGRHAEIKGGLRGSIFPGTVVQWERSEYTGKHWIECFIVKDRVCVARKKFYIHVRNPNFLR